MNSMHNSFGGSGGYPGPYPGYVPPPAALPYYNGYPGDLTQVSSPYYGKPTAAPPGYSSGMGSYSAPPINNSSMYYQQYGLGYQYGYTKYGLGSGLGSNLGYSSELAGASGITPPSLGVLQAPTTDLGLTGSMFSKGKYSGNQGSPSPLTSGIGIGHGSSSSLLSPVTSTPPSPGPHNIPGGLAATGATPSPPVDMIESKKDLDKMRRCQVCGQVFRLMSECLAHMKSVHAVHEGPLSMYSLQHGAGGHLTQSLTSSASVPSALSSSLGPPNNTRTGGVGAPDSPLMALERMGWGEKQGLLPSLHASPSPLTPAYTPAPAVTPGPQHPSTQHLTSQHPSSQHPSPQLTANQLPSAQHSSPQNPSSLHASQQLSSAQHPTSQHHPQHQSSQHTPQQSSSSQHSSPQTPPTSHGLLEANVNEIHPIRSRVNSLSATYSGRTDTQVSQAQNRHPYPNPICSVQDNLSVNESTVDAGMALSYAKPRKASSYSVSSIIGETTERVREKGSMMTHESANSFIGHSPTRRQLSPTVRQPSLENYEQHVRSEQTQDSCPSDGSQPLGGEYIAQDPDDDKNRSPSNDDSDIQIKREQEEEAAVSTAPPTTEEPSDAQSTIEQKIKAEEGEMPEDLSQHTAVPSPSPSPNLTTHTSEQVLVKEEEVTIKDEYIESENYQYDEEYEDKCESSPLNYTTVPKKEDEKEENEDKLRTSVQEAPQSPHESMKEHSEIDPLPSSVKEESNTQEKCTWSPQTAHFERQVPPHMSYQQSITLPHTMQEQHMHQQTQQPSAPSPVTQQQQQQHQQQLQHQHQQQLQQHQHLQQQQAQQQQLPQQSQQQQLPQQSQQQQLQQQQQQQEQQHQLQQQPHQLQQQQSHQQPSPHQQPQPQSQQSQPPQQSQPQQQLHQQSQAQQQSHQQPQPQHQQKLQQQKQHPQQLQQQQQQQQQRPPPQQGYPGWAGAGYPGPGGQYPYGYSQNNSQNSSGSPHSHSPMAAHKSSNYHPMSNNYGGPYGNPAASGYPSDLGNRGPPGQQAYSQSHWYPSGGPGMDAKSGWNIWANQGHQPSNYPQPYSPYPYPGLSQQQKMQMPPQSQLASQQQHQQPPQKSTQPPPAQTQPSPQPQMQPQQLQQTQQQLGTTPPQAPLRPHASQTPQPPTQPTTPTPPQPQPQPQSQPPPTPTPTPTQALQQLNQSEEEHEGDQQNAEENSCDTNADDEALNLEQKSTDHIIDCNSNDSASANHSLPKKPLYKIGPKSKTLAAKQYSQIDDLDDYKCTITVHENGSLNGYSGSNNSVTTSNNSQSYDSSDSEINSEEHSPTFVQLRPAKRRKSQSREGVFIGPKRIKQARLVRERQERRHRHLEEQLRQTELEEQIQAIRVEKSSEEDGPLGNMLVQSSIILADSQMEEQDNVEQCIASIKAQQLSLNASENTLDIENGDKVSSVVSGQPVGRKAKKSHASKVFHNENSVIVKNLPRSKALRKLRAKDFKWSHYIKSMRYWCSDCAHGFKNQKEVSSHSEDRCKWNCLYMLECYVIVNDVQAHAQYGPKVQELLEEYQIDGQHKCKTCGEVIARKADFLVHCDSHKDFMPWECTICGTRFKIRGSLKEHLRYTHMKGRVPCLKCNKVFPTSTLLRQHVKVHTQHYKYKTTKNRDEELKAAMEATAGALEAPPEVVDEEAEKLSDEANEYRNWCKLMEINAMKNIGASTNTPPEEKKKNGASS